MKINNGDCEYTIETKAFKDIAQNACLKIKDVEPAKKDTDFVDVKIDKQQNISITLEVRIKRGLDLQKICTKIQEEVNENILMMTGLNCNKINIDIQGFINQKKS